MNNKICTVCDIEKIKTDFYASKHSPDGYETQCKICRGIKLKKTSEGKPKKKYRVMRNGEKTCIDCKIMKHITEFPINRAVKTGRKKVCSKCDNMAFNIKRRKNGPIFKPIFTSELIPDKTEYKTGNCEVCNTVFDMCRKSHRRCDNCTDLVRDVHRHLSMKRGKRIVQPEKSCSRVDAAVLVARMLCVSKQCKYCKRGYTVENTKQIDHIIPVHLGGTHELSNITICCKECNISKNRSTLIEWIALCKIIAGIKLTPHNLPTKHITTKKMNGRSCALCEIGIEDLHQKSLYCLPCKDVIKRICSSLTSSRGYGAAKKSYKCSVYDVREVAKKWNMAEKCCYCDRAFSDILPKSPDHMVPICLGGQNIHDNVNICCVECNRAKARMTIEKWTGLCELVAKNN